MKPTYPYNEMRDLIRMINSAKEVKIIQMLLRQEGRRYTINEIHSLHKQLQIAEINLSFK